MRLHPFVVLLPACFIASSVAGDAAFPLTAKRILFLGDSITNAGYYVADIETQLRVQGVDPLPEMINIGLSSETCSGLSEPDHPFPRPDVHERLDRALEKVKPDVVVACYGMNDGIYYPFSEDRFAKYQEGINRLISKVKTAGAKIVLVTPPPFDPLPLRKKAGKLLPAGADKYAWFAIYEDYDAVIKRYGKWVLQQTGNADMVIDVHGPLSDFLAEQRKTDPEFQVAADGVHMDAAGHEIMARAILKAWGVESWETVSDDLRKTVRKKEKTLHDAWLSHVGHKRPGVKAGLPLEEARQKAKDLEQEIEELVRAARAPSVSQRMSTGGTIHQVHYPALLKGGQLKLYVDYYLWVPNDVDSLRGIIVHQHGCGPGASIGGQTAADDLHWQELARRQKCALLGSSYEPRKGVNCRLWCDARSGSALRFLEAVDHFADASGHLELKTVPWCLWGHSGGGFWASLMQTLYPERIVAIWLQSGTAFGYWTAGEIEEPSIPEAAYGVPVMANPGLKEKDHERFHVAYDGSKAMQKEYLSKGAAFFEFAADPRTGHECGDSRYFSIPFFDFWLTQRIPAEGDPAVLLPVSEHMLSAWAASLAKLHTEFTTTGAVGDTTPPPPPVNVQARRLDDGSVRVTWTASADFESGLRGFLVRRDGLNETQVPQNPTGRFGRPLFQRMSYHDTPEQPLPKMEFIDHSAPADRLPVYEIRSVNSVLLQSVAASSK